MAEETAHIARVFAERFARWKIELPARDVQRRQNGHIYEQGWHIGYVWGEQDGLVFLDFLSQHRMTDDEHARIWASGDVEQLPAPSDWLVIPPGATEGDTRRSEDAQFSSNREIYAHLRAKGLLPHPSADIGAAELNEFLASGGMVAADRREEGIRLFACAVQTAADLVDGGPPASFLERRLERALIAAFDQQLVEPGLAVGVTKLAVPDWTAHLGGVDLVIRHEPNGEPRFVAELKVDDIDQSLWDLFKVLALTREPTIDAAFLIVAATRKRWDSSLACAPLFPALPGPPQRWDTRTMFYAWRRAWEYLLAGGTARPLRIPSSVQVAFVACVPVRAYPMHELRAVCVYPSDDSTWIPFDGDWPAEGDLRPRDG